MARAKTRQFIEDKFIVRCPTLPFQAADKIAVSYRDESGLSDYLTSPEKLEALYIASPSLIKELTCSYKKNKGVRPLQALAKYLLRMSTRSTPFGLFSGVFLGKFESNTCVEINTEKSKRRSRLSFDILNLLHHQVVNNEEIANALSYRPSTSIYRIGNDYRYIKTEFLKGKKKYGLEHVISSENLQESLNFFDQGATITSYLDFMESLGYNRNDSQEFVSTLIRAQILIPETHPYTIGNPYLPYLIESIKLKFVENPKEIHFLQRVLDRLELLDSNGVNSISAYRQLETDLMKKIGTDLTNPVQIDLYYKTKVANINRAEKNIIENGYKVLKKISFPKNHERLETFKHNFLERYAGKPMRLAEVLDPDCGLGYPITQEYDEYWYLEGIEFNHKEYRPAPIPPSTFDKLLRFKLDCHTNDDPIRLTDRELAEVPEQKIDVPPTFYALTERYVLDGKPIYYMPSIGTTTATSLLARFSGHNREIDDLLEKICRHEAEAFKDAICADIDHIPEDRTGNILFRKNFRDAIIPFMSGVKESDVEHLLVSDIYVTVAKGKLVLTKGMHGKRIIPFLSNAHNYERSPLPMYIFLCDLQYAHTNADLSFQWGNVGKHRVYLPRVIYKDVILSKAKWNLSKKILDEFFTMQTSISMVQMKKFQKHWRIPDNVCLAKGDNLLYLDLKTQLGRDLFLFETRKASRFILEEFINCEQPLIKNQYGQAHTNQIVFTFKSELK